MTADSAARRISDQLQALGVPPDGLLLVHASMRALGPVPGGAETVIQGLLRAIAPGGTLLMPALSWEQVPPDLHSTLHTPSHVGALAEIFRTRDETRRSVHPTHSVCAVGPLAHELLDPHRLDHTPCGPNSPFRRLLDRDARIVMLGCGLRPNTTMHALEELVEPPYLFGPEVQYTLTDDRGETYGKTYRTHGFAGWEQRYDRVLLLDHVAFLRSGPVLNSQTFVLDTRGLRDAVVARLREDPLFFVDRLPG